MPTAPVLFPLGAKEPQGTLIGPRLHKMRRHCARRVLCTVAPLEVTSLTRKVKAATQSSKGRENENNICHRGASESPRERVQRLLHSRQPHLRRLQTLPAACPTCEPEESCYSSRHVLRPAGHASSVSCAASHHGEVVRGLAKLFDLVVRPRPRHGPHTEQHRSTRRICNYSTIVRDS